METYAPSACFENCIYYGNSVAEDLFNKGLCLPSGSNLTEEQKIELKSCFENEVKKQQKLNN